MIDFNRRSTSGSNSRDTIHKSVVASWFLASITAGWAIYLLTQFIIGLAANLGMDGGLDQGGQMSDLSNAQSLALHLLDLLALSGYAIAAGLIFRQKALSVPVYGVAFTIDLGVWITASASYAGYELTSLMHTSLVNWLINAVLLVVLLGLVVLQQAKVLR